MLSENDEELGPGVEWDPFPASQPLDPSRFSFAENCFCSPKHTLHLSMYEMYVMWPGAERLRGKSCAVTGASEGLGAVIAIHLAQAGVTCQHLISAQRNLSWIFLVGDDSRWRH